MADMTLMERYAQLTAAGRAFVTVTLVDAVGSTPQDAGSKMIVTPDGLDYGTVGGGRVEAKAIQLATAMLSDKRATQFVDWNLQADVGMTCGGRVRLFFESVHVAVWPIVIFGAGHITQALSRLLIALPCRVTCIDPRREWIERLPEPVMRVCDADPQSRVADLPGDAFVLCMTQGHMSDLPVLRQIYQLPHHFPFVGVIGSQSKATRLRRELVDAGIDSMRLDFHCPVGLPLGTNHPAEIAVSIAAQLLQVRDAQVPLERATFCAIEISPKSCQVPYPKIFGICGETSFVRRGPIVKAAGSVKLLNLCPAALISV